MPRITYCSVVVLLSNFTSSVCYEKTRLGNPEVRKVVDQSVQEFLTEYLELHPDVLDSILSKALNALKVLFSPFHCAIFFPDPYT